MYGFFNNIPISIGVGYQQGPSLRKVNEDATLTIADGRGGNRIMGTITVDIPITNFFTR